MIFRNWVLQNFPFLEDDFDALTDYELFCKMVEYMKKSLDKVVEYQAELNDFRNELDTYKNYFDNIDVQEEINNKLDEMAESGELTDIIAQYLGLAGVLAYNTLAELEDAENVANGSICMILGKDTYNDGKSAYYKIRTILNTDVIDGDNIIAITNDNTLVGEKMPKYDINQINNKIDLINSNDTIFLGDSYANGTTYESGSVQYLTSWCEYLSQLMGLTTGHYYRFYQGNAGFSKIGNNSMNFKMTLESHLSDVTNKNAIKNIIVCAGYNDYDQSYADIKTKISEFISFCKTNFPNAQVYIGMIGGNAVDSETGRNVRNKLLTVVLNAYSKCNEYGGIYLSGVELFSHNFAQFNSQGNHPNEAGYKYVANMIYNAWKNGACEMYEPISSVTLSSSFSGVNFNYQVMINNSVKTVFFDNFIVNGLSLTGAQNNLTIVPANNNGLIKTSIDGKTQVLCDMYVKDANNAQFFFPGKLIFKPDGSVSIYATYLVFSTGIKDLIVWPTTIDMPTMLS